MTRAERSAAVGLLVSERLRALGLRHGFSTRVGGVSRGPFASLNLGPGLGDDPRALEENRRRLEAAAGPVRLAEVEQVHGDRVIEVRAESDLEALRAEQADALVTSAPEIAVAVRTADCVPLLAAGAGGARVAAIHAGWRGTLAGVAARAVAALGGGEEVRVAIGPSIRRCCYEVDEALARRFADALGAGVALRREGRWHLDLVEANLRVLERAGVSRGEVEVLDACTACDGARFFSHRRDGGRTGRHLSFVAPRGFEPE